MLGTQAALMDKQLSYSRNQEREADRIGMQFMYSAGYNHKAWQIILKPCIVKQVV
jgi:predicted Zn-dependent protease